METRSNKAWSAHSASLLVLVLISAVTASSDSTKTVEFNVKPGGVVHTFTEKIGNLNYQCLFTYAAQGGTNEQWLMSIGLTKDRMFSCSVWRPQGKSYLFFTEFRLEVMGVQLEYGNAYSQTAVAGQTDVPLKPEEFTVDDTTVSHTPGKFSAQLSKVTAIGRTQHLEL